MIISKDTPKTVKVNVCAFMTLACGYNLFGALHSTVCTRILIYCNYLTINAKLPKWMDFNTSQSDEIHSSY